MKNDDLIRRLCEASEGSAELSAEVWTALTGRPFYASEDGYCVDSEAYGNDYAASDYGGHPCLTTSLSAAWEEAEGRGYIPLLCGRDDDSHYTARMYSQDSDSSVANENANTAPLALCAALLAAEGSR